MSAIGYDGKHLDITAVVATNTTITGYTAVRLTNATTESGLVCTTAADANSPILGIAQVDDNISVTAGNQVSVRVMGVSKAIAGAAISAGALVTANAGGTVAPLTSGHAVGIALTPAANTGDEILILIKQMFKPA